MPGDVVWVGSPATPGPRLDAKGSAALTAALAKLVATLSQARTQAAERASHADLAALVQRARADLDAADEVLLVLDRHGHRSAFRRAARIRHRLEGIEIRLAAGQAPQWRERRLGARS